jgi:hypothetical protein
MANGVRQSPTLDIEIASPKKLARNDEIVIY